MPGKRAVQRRTPTVQSERVRKKAKEREKRERKRERRSVHKVLRLRAAALCRAYSQINLAALQANWQQGQRDKQRERGRESIAHCSTSNESPSRSTLPTSIRCCNLPGARPHFCYFIIAVVCTRCLCECVCVCV